VPEWSARTTIIAGSGLMEQLLPIIVGVVALIVVLKMLKGVVKMVGIAVIVALVAALYFGMNG
jgi:L-lactate permease